MTASRTTPTLWVLVIMTGPSRNPDSSTQVVPVISPLPFSENQPAKTGSSTEALPRGRMAVTPVRTGPLPTTSAPSPGDQGGVADLDPGDVGDGVERTGGAVERHTQVPGAGLLGRCRAAKAGVLNTHHTECRERGNRMTRVHFSGSISTANRMALWISSIFRSDSRTILDSR